MNNVVRIVHEKGLTIQKDIFGLWRFRSAVGSETHSFIDPNQIENIYSLRRVLMIDLLTLPRFPFPRELSYVLNTTGSGFLETQRWELPPNVDTSHLSDIVDLQYVVGAVIYHCRRLAEASSEICFHAVKFFPPPPVSTVFNSPNNCEAYYEFDALVTAARRMYEMARCLLWAVFEGKGKRPEDFRKVLKTLKNDLPSDLAGRLNRSWSQFGEKLREYRVTIQHYSPIDLAMCTAQVERLQGGIWVTSLPIPDNPEDQSKRKFRYAGKIDALTYGWEIANEIVDVASAIVNAIPQKTAFSTKEEAVA